MPVAAGAQRSAVSLQDCGPWGGTELTAFQLVHWQPLGPFPQCTGNLYANPGKSSQLQANRNLSGVAGATDHEGCSLDSKWYSLICWPSGPAFVNNVVSVMSRASGMKKMSLDSTFLHRVGRGTNSLLSFEGHQQNLVVVLVGSVSSLSADSVLPIAAPLAPCILP